jgi:hypothetical protein
MTLRANQNAGAAAARWSAFGRACHHCLCRALLGLLGTVIGMIEIFFWSLAAAAAVLVLETPLTSERRASPRSLQHRLRLMVRFPH